MGEISIPKKKTGKQTNIFIINLQHCEVEKI